MTLRLGDESRFAKRECQPDDRNAYDDKRNDFECEEGLAGRWLSYQLRGTTGKSRYAEKQQGEAKE